MKLPTDLKILTTIFHEYADEYAKYDIEAPEKRHRLIYLPIDINQLAERLKTNRHMLYGRLYFHLNHVYGYRHNDDTEVHLFAKKVDDDLHCINYPYLAGILSEKRTEHVRNLRALRVSIVSLALAVVSLGWQVYSQLVSSHTG